MQKTTPAQHVVVTGLLRQRGRALMVHRSPHRRWYPDTWDLPGGQVITGEVPRSALARELHEELGITVDVAGEPFAHVEGADFRMDVWVIDQWIGAPVNAAPEEHDALAWMSAHELHGLRLADPRLPQLINAALGVTE